MGEVPAAFIVTRPGKVPTEDDLRRFCRERMPPYKVPVSFTRVDALPRNEAGKLLRAVLVQRLLATASGGRGQAAEADPERPRP